MSDSNDYDGFIILADAKEESRRTHGAEIFTRVINYLRILAAERFYPRGRLTD